MHDLPVIYRKQKYTMSTIRKIIEQYFGQQQPEDIQRKFLFWLKSPVLAKEKEDTMSQLWDNLSISSDLSTGKSYKQVEKRLGITKHTSRHLFYIRLTRIAAIFLIPVLSVLSAWLYVQSQQPQGISLVECSVPNGEIREIELPDDSRVVINSGTTLFYQEEFKGKTREIYLSGEAKFIVSPNKKKPFVVKTNDMLVEALGTIFNVSSYPDNPYTTATLVEGKVGVDIRLTKENFIINPSEQIIYDKTTGQSIRKQARVDYVLAWEKGQMAFLSAPLHIIIKELECRHGVTIYLNDTGLSEEKLTVKFLYNESLEEILHVLQQIINGFQFKIEGNKIYIY
jgi:ferric-dicitrate binding protein FerR (iron transport regulator)